MNPSPVPNVLVVGAGAVGQIYGFYFQQGGAQVSFLVKEKHRADTARALVIYWLKSFSSKRTLTRMTGHGVMTSAAEVSTRRWDYVVFAMSSTGLRGPWLDDLLPAIPNATIVMLQPGLDDLEYLLAKIPAARLIEGMIPIVSYFAPMAGEIYQEPGLACWVPPGQKGLFKGPVGKVQPLLEILRAGGFACSASDDLGKTDLVPSVALSGLIAALELEQWSFAKLKQSPRLPLACRAMREAVTIVARKRDLPQPRFQFLLTPALFRLVLWGTRYVVPFDFEAYLKLHFTKVGDQMHQGMRDYIAAGEKLRLPVIALKQIASD